MARSSRPLSQALCVMFVLSTAPAVHAQYTFFAKNTTLNYPTGETIVGYADYNDFTTGANGTSPTVNMVHGGEISSLLLTYNSSQFNLKAGRIDSFVDVRDKSRFNLLGGYADEVIAYNHSKVNLKHGDIGTYLFAYDSSVVNVRGGGIGGALLAYGGGTLNFYGQGLGATLVNPDVSGTSKYSLKGRLSDGTDITGESLFVQNGTSASFHFFNGTAVPENSVTLDLFIAAGIGGAELLRRRRTRSQQGEA